MLIVQRQQRLLELLEARQTASLEELSRELDVSASTVRRDLESLEKRGAVERTHGGAVYKGRPRPNGGLSPHPSLATRMRENTAAKRAIGAAAAAMVEPNMTVMLDGGSTVVIAAEQITARPIQVVTNSLSIAQMFKDDESAEIVLAGGTLYPRTEVTTGALCRGTLAELHADIAFMSLAGIYDNDAFNINMSMANVEQVMMRQATRCVLLMDASKFGRRSLARVASLDEFDRIITDSAIDSDWRDRLGERLIVA